MLTGVTKRPNSGARRFEFLHQGHGSRSDLDGVSKAVENTESTALGGHRTQFPDTF